MAFQSLYRKYRPQRFSEMLGQEHVTTALRNAVRESRVGHAYLFSGPRGTGKTTTARILAKALNCTDLGADGEPCGVCDSCLEIARGGSMDVIELDAASNNGVGEMRALLERVALSSAGGRYRVYIVDEVHMLTSGAENALLKTLEEPPEHVIFVLATTDPQKVAATIRSRTQHFEFSLFSTDDLAGYLAGIAEHEKVDADFETLRLIARRGAGSARDALSVLDQALALGDGALDAEAVRGLFEATPFSRQVQIVEAIASEDVPEVLAAVSDIVGAGLDARQVADDLLRYLRNAFLLLAGRGQVRVEVLEEEREQLVAHGEALGLAGMTRAIETLGESAVDMRRAPDPRLVLEVALVRLARREAGAGTDLLLERLERLERTVDDLRRGATAPAAVPMKPPTPAATSTDQAPADKAPAEPAPAAPPGEASPSQRPTLGALRKREGAATPPAQVEPAAPPDPNAAPVPVAQQSTPTTLAAAAAEPFTLDDAVLAWPDALATLRPRLRAMAREAQPVEVEGGTVVLGIPDRFPVHRKTIDDESGALADALGQALGGRSVRIRVTTHGGFMPEAPESGPGEGAGDQTDLETGEGPGEPEPGAEAPEGPVDTIGQLVEAFGATVDEEPEPR
jgi:DNA polymerase-3 subunit gamma/tau